MSENVPVKRTMPGMPVSAADAQKQGLSIFMTPEESLNITKGELAQSFKQRVASAQQQLAMNYMANHPEGAPALDTQTPDAELSGKAAMVMATWLEEHPDFAQQYTIEQAAFNGKSRQLDTEIAQYKSVQEQKSRDVMKFDKLGQKEAMQEAGIAAGNAKKAFENHFRLEPACASLAALHDLQLSRRTRRSFRSDRGLHSCLTACCSTCRGKDVHGC